MRKMTVCHQHHSYCSTIFSQRLVRLKIKLLRKKRIKLLWFKPMGLCWQMLHKWILWTQYNAQVPIWLQIFFNDHFVELGFSYLFSFASSSPPLSSWALPVSFFALCEQFKFNKWNFTPQFFLGVFCCCFKCAMKASKHIFFGHIRLSVYLWLTMRWDMLSAYYLPSSSASIHP